MLNKERLAQVMPVMLKVATRDQVLDAMVDIGVKFDFADPAAIEPFAHIFRANHALTGARLMLTYLGLDKD